MNLEMSSKLHDLIRKHSSVTFFEKTGTIIRKLLDKCGVRLEGAGRRKVKSIRVRFWTVGKNQTHFWSVIRYLFKLFCVKKIIILVLPEQNPALDRRHTNLYHRPPFCVYRRTDYSTEMY